MMVYHPLFEVRRTVSKHNERSLIMADEVRKAKTERDAQYSPVGLLIPSRIQNP
jgi:hypothetical protein